MAQQPKISAVLVNYNVKDYIDQALASLQRALATIPHEIIVVDNASVDGSVHHIRERFPEVTLIESQENLGFGKANNVALQQVCGEFVVLINPDTVVQEDTFTELLRFFESTPDAGAATCKIINPDGSFSVDCRHSIPTPSIALWKVLGLSKLFPKSKTFARYNLTYLDPDETYPVPAVSGSFMMIRKTVLDDVGQFDERFFMYCEDIDLCHRINLAGYQIYYVPTTQIIHYKGESTKKNNIDYVVTFNKALYQFFEKHYARNSAFLFRWLIVLGIVARGVFIYLRNFLQEHFPLILDTIILNLVILVSFIIRLEVKNAFLWENFFDQYWIINVISTVVFWIANYYLEVFPYHRFSIQGIIKVNISTFVLLGCLTFFFKQFAFSRMVTLMAAIASPILMISWRALLKRSFQGDRSVWGKDLFSKPSLIVGTQQSAAGLYQKIRDLKDLSYELIGVVTLRPGETAAFDAARIPVLGTVDNLPELIRMHQARQVIFASEELSYEQILQTMSNLGMPQLEFKIAPSGMEVMIGKSSIDRLDDYPLVEVEYALGKPLNRFSKRVMDLLVSGSALLAGAIAFLPILLFYRSRLERYDFKLPRAEKGVVYQLSGDGHRPINLWLKFWSVFRGACSLVGAPLNLDSQAVASYSYRPGLTGLVQLNQKRIQAPDDQEKYHLFYLKNQSILLDLEIMLKTITGG